MATRLVGRSSGSPSLAHSEVSLRAHGHPTWQRQRIQPWLVSCGLVLVCLGCRHAADDAPLHAHGQVTYHLEADLAAGSWEVRAYLPPDFAGVRICLPAIGHRAGESFHLHGMWIAERAAMVRPDPSGCFSLPATPEPITLHYQVAVHPQPRPAWRVTSLSPQSHAGFLFFPGESLFLEVAQRHEAARLPTRVAITPLPEGLGMASTLAVEDHHLLAPNNRHLLRSILWIEEGLALLTLPHPTAQLNVAVAPAFTQVPERLLEDITTLVSALHCWAPQRTPPHMAILLLPAQWDLGARIGFARQGGVVLQVGSAALNDRIQQARLIAHEVFHLYNGEGLECAPDAWEQTEWFREGMTNYVAALVVAQSGIGTPADFLAQLAEHASAYLLNPARSGHSATELDWARLPYDHGVLLSLALDLMLRDISQNQRSLRGFWRHLATSVSWEQAHDNRSLRQAFSAYAGTSFTPFFTPFIDDKVTLPVHALLRNAGLTLSNTTTTHPSLGVEIGYDVERVELVALAVERGSMAQRAGLEVGDIIRPLATTRFDQAEPFITFEVIRDAMVIFVRLLPETKVLPALALRLDEAREGLLSAILAEPPLDCLP